MRYLISAVGYLDRTKIPVGIDIGFGDVIYPDAVKMDFPVMTDMMDRVKVFVRPVIEGRAKVKWNPENGIWE